MYSTEYRMFCTPVVPIFPVLDPTKTPLLCKVLCNLSFVIVIIYLGKVLEDRN